MGDFSNCKIEKWLEKWIKGIDFISKEYWEKAICVRSSWLSFVLQFPSFLSSSRKKKIFMNREAKQLFLFLRVGIFHFIISRENSCRPLTHLIACLYLNGNFQQQERNCIFRHKRRRFDFISYSQPASTRSVYFLMILKTSPFSTKRGN